MFSGVFQHSIDAKGRTSLPSSFREQLAAQGADKLFITNDLLDPCLIAFTPEAFKRVADQVSKMKMFDQTARLLLRSFIAPAQECPVDKVGRILIPPTLREHAALVEEITWAGNWDRIEVWSPAKWEAEQKKARKPDTKEELQKRLSELL